LKGAYKGLAKSSLVKRASVKKLLLMVAHANDWLNLLKKDRAASNE
jgi:hypothetical protein